MRTTELKNAGGKGVDCGKTNGEGHGGGREGRLEKFVIGGGSGGREGSSRRELS